MDETIQAHSIHEIQKHFSNDEVLRAEELVRCENGSALILENTEGLPLRKLMDSARLELPDSLKVALSLIGILKEVHRQGILHKMINPFNIFVDPASGNIKLSGFGLATRIPRENLTTWSPQLTGETLPYISPEKTGRMNRPSIIAVIFIPWTPPFMNFLQGECLLGPGRPWKSSTLTLPGSPRPLTRLNRKYPESFPAW